jgi:hypothetical protein
MRQEEANPQPTRRRVMQYAGLALANVYLSEPSAALAAEPQEAVSPTYPDQISDVMERLSNYRGALL